MARREKAGGARPPWDVLPYFAQPVYTYVTLANQFKQVLKANPMRWAVIFSTDASNTLVVTTDASGIKVGLAWQGIMMPAAFPRFEATFADYGPLVSADWYAGTANAQVNLVAVEIILTKWPEGGTREVGVYGAGDRPTRNDRGSHNRG